MKIEANFFSKEYYCIYYLLDNDKIVYIGKTKRPSDRFIKHYNSKMDFDSIEYIQVDKEDLNDFEKEQIRHYKPKYNKKYKD
jgi:excinuclease UvrABC nuclease subunit